MIIDNAVYRHGVRVPMQCDPDDLAAMRAGLTGNGDFVWIGLHQPSGDEMAEVVKVFGLHRYAVDDALQAHQRPKLASYGDSLLLVLKTLWYVDEHDAVETGEISVFIGTDFIVTVRHGEGSELHTARALLESKQLLLSHGPSAVVFAICDTVVDAYVDVASALEQDVDEVESSVFSATRTDDSARIYTLKREIAEVRRAVLPLREPMGRLADGEPDGIAADMAPFFRDVGGNLAKAWDIVDSLDRLLSTAFDAHLASISVRQNEDMRKISAWVALAAVPTLIAGIYGMNFDHMPELGWQYGYPMALGLMLGIVGCLWGLFKRSGWL